MASARSVDAPGSVPALPEGITGMQERGTADADSTAVPTCDGNTGGELHASCKASMVDALLDLSDIALPLAIAWACAIQVRWPDFKEV